MNTRPCGLFTVALTWLLLTIPATAQEPIDTHLFDQVDVSIVNVDVVVVDKRGRPVTGLTADDFLLFEDGETVEIANFYAITSDGRRILDAAAPRPSALRSSALPDARPAILDQSPEATADSPDALDPVLLVLYVDNLHLTPHRRNTFLDQIREVIHQTSRPQDRVMVVTHRNGLDVIQTFTNDPAVVERALGTIRQSSADGLRDRSERRQTMDQIRDVFELALETNQEPCQDQFDLMLSAARSYASAAQARAARSLQGLNGLTSALAGIPGRKIVLYLSDGIDLLPGLDLFHYLADLCIAKASDALREGQQINLGQAFHRLTSQANANRITFYTVDGAGLQSNSAADARLAGPITGGYDLRPSAQNDSVRRSNRQNTIFTLADETGGQAFLNGNDVRTELTDMSRDARSYYALGFSSGRDHDGRVHRVKVKLAEERKGAKLHYRRTYLDKTAETRTAERTLAAMRFGFEDNPLDVKVANGDTEVAADGQRMLPLQISLALGEIVTIPENGQYKGQVQVVISAEDEHDRPLEMRQQTIPILIAENMIEAARAGRHVVEVSVPVNIGETVLAVAVRDTLANTTSYVQYRLRVAPDAGTT